MPAYEFALIVFFVSTTAGLVGSLTGLGGGVIVTPALTVLLGVDIRYAIGASLVSVIATSSGAAAAYVRDGLSNIRIGMFLWRFPELSPTTSVTTAQLQSEQTTRTRLRFLYIRGGCDTIACI